MPTTHDNAVLLTINVRHGSCATALALATRRPIICRRLGFRSGCCKYVEQCKTAIYWDLALDFTLVHLRWTAFIFSNKSQLEKWLSTTSKWYLHLWLHRDQVFVRISLFFVSFSPSLSKKHARVGPKNILSPNYLDLFFQKMTTQRNATLHNTTQHNTTQRNTT